MKLGTKSQMECECCQKYRATRKDYRFYDDSLPSMPIYVCDYCCQLNDVWFDRVNCNPSIKGNELRRILEKEIRERDILLLITTENSLHGSWWVEQETNILGFFKGEEEAKRKLILVTFSAEVKDQSIVDYYFNNTGLSRFHKCDLISIDNIEHASEWALQWYLNADIPLSKFDKQG